MYSSLHFFLYIYIKCSINVLFHCRNHDQRKRVSIAMEMVIRPQMLILDEPLSGLGKMNQILD